MVALRVVVFVPVMVCTALAPSLRRRLRRGTRLRSTPRRPLHRLADVAASGFLDVGEGHELYYELRGVDADLPLALWLHGGPGAGCAPNHARFLDPARWRVCLVDQRGCGRSRCASSPLESNDTPRLVNDLEVLRRTVRGGDRAWDCVVGGSWGSTLALAYCVAHPRAARSIVLRAVCLMRAREIDWLFSPDGGAAALAPKAWATFAAHVGGGRGRRVLEAYLRRSL